MNTIALRICDFLKDFPPFSVLQKEDLLAIASAVEVIYLKKDELLFDVGEAVKPNFYVVRNGAVGLIREDLHLVDECDEGDIFGLRALLRQGDYKLRAKSLEESVIYSISAELLGTYITSHAEASQFLMTSFASNTLSYSTETSEAFNQSYITKSSSELQTADYSKDPITCSKATRIKEAAEIMTKKRVGSIVVTDNHLPIGIITDKDLRTKIATGRFPISATVDQIMSSPVITYPEDISVAEAQIAMLKHRITHLCITKDGTTDTELTGVLSEHDIIVLRENNASFLMKDIKRSETAQDLKGIRERATEVLERYLHQDIPIDFIGRIISAINEAITQRCIKMAISKMKISPPVDFAWLSIGSQGRQEQLLLTDQDHMLVFENTSPENYDEVKDYFLQLAEYITNYLNTVGFELCPARMMANNPKWCLSLDQWKNQFSQWITSPDQDHLMLCTIFFDYDRVYGDKCIVDELSEHIFKCIKTQHIFLTYLGRNALQNPPPLSFFRQFLVEESGEHKDQFDIKARAIMPLVDAARLLTLYHNTKAINNTVERYEMLVTLEPQNKDVYLFCIESFKDLLKFRTQQGLKHNDSGRFIDLTALSKGDKLKLKRSFKAVKAIQQLIQTRFKLAHII